MARSERESSPPQGGEESLRDHTAALHETTNALTVILGWIERARQAAGTDPAGAATALERASRTALSTKAALRHAIGAGAADEPAARVDELAQRTVDDLVVEASRRELSLQLDVDPACASWRIDQTGAVWQILTNLLLNAIEASPPNGTVRLTVKREGGQARRARFSVADQGPGIPTDSRDQIFRAGVSGRSGGAGIGLWHARTLTRRHGGELEPVDSKRGARFDLCWPCAPPGGASRRAASESTGATPGHTSRSADGGRSGLDGRRVLLLEDDAAVVELLELTLTARGATLTSVADPAELLAALGEGDVDTLLVDLSPLTDSVDALLEQVQAIRPELVVIVISGRAGEHAGVAAWVRKPFEPSELIAAIAAAHGETSPS